MLLQIYKPELTKEELKHKERQKKERDRSAAYRQRKRKKEELECSIEKFKLQVLFTVFSRLRLKYIITVYAICKDGFREE